MNPTDIEWWWRYGFDGVVGALLGGLVAGAVAALILKRTVTHERKLAREVAVMELAAKVRGAAIRLLIPLATSNASGRDVLPQITDLQATAYELTGLAARDWPVFSKRISDLMPPISKAIGDDLFLQTPGMISPAIWDEVTAISAACEEFLRDPDAV